MGRSYPSREIQSVYSISLADWTNIYRSNEKNSFHAKKSETITDADNADDLTLHTYTPA